MVFALRRVTVGKKVKQLPVIRKKHSTCNSVDDE
jgi:hypothetical protein